VTLLFVVVAVFLATLLVALALLPPGSCSVCGEPPAYPMHYACAYRRCPGLHHPYRSSPGLSTIVLALLVIDGGLFLVTR
jgi:hypothetical protein